MCQCLTEVVEHGSVLKPLHELRLHDPICIGATSLVNTSRSTTNLNVDIADKVVAQVIAHVHLLHLAILLLHLCEDLLCGEIRKEKLSSRFFSLVKLVS